ncbi:hypothetical protein WMY93_029532 [Mugilogobius chulae]|uniref:Uncharacterized protein n=1 Tax=Mugilogobius chulae TaxID=88201 RepID=A0AAW0MS09_9GOBI
MRCFGLSRWPQEPTDTSDKQGQGWRWSSDGQQDSPVSYPLSEQDCLSPGQADGEAKEVGHEGKEDVDELNVNKQAVCGRQPGARQLLLITAETGQVPHIRHESATTAALCNRATPTAHLLIYANRLSTKNMEIFHPVTEEQFHKYFISSGCGSGGAEGLFLSIVGH